MGRVRDEASRCRLHDPRPLPTRGRGDPRASREPSECSATRSAEKRESYRRSQGRGAPKFATGNRRRRKRKKQGVSLASKAFCLFFGRSLANRARNGLLPRAYACFLPDLGRTPRTAPLRACLGVTVCSLRQSACHVLVHRVPFLFAYGYLSGTARLPPRRGFAGKTRTPALSFAAQAYCLRLAGDGRSRVESAAGALVAESRREPRSRKCRIRRA